MTLETLVELTALITFVGAIFMWINRQTISFFERLESLLPTKLMFMAFGTAFALCAAAQIYGLSKPSPVPQLEAVFQWSAIAFFLVALLLCGVAILVTLIDGICKYMTRTPIVFVDYFDPNEPHF